jgi:haloacetate dehalogenase
MPIADFETRIIRTSSTDIAVSTGGAGPPLLLIHGYPQMRTMWHATAPALARTFRVVAADLRGYGDSSKPPAGDDFSAYSKRAMAADMVEVMSALGHESFFVAGHDRGARVAHRLALDHPERVRAACVMDIAPTLHMFDTTDQKFATGYYHWFFLIQPDGLPEHLIGLDPQYYVKEKLRRWAAPGAQFDPSAVAEYVRAFTPETIRASCDDYRAAASIDLDHDRADRSRRVTCPLLVLWGAKGFVQRTYNVLDVWRDYASVVSGRALDCGHFLPEEAAPDVIAELELFFSAY